MDKNIALCFLVAGLSKRFNGKIKAFAKVGPNNTSLIEYTLINALANKFSKIVFIVSKTTFPSFKEFFKDEYHNLKIEYVFQDYDPHLRERPWGTGDAVSRLLEVNNTNKFIICNGDDIYGKETIQVLYNHLIKNNDNATIGHRLSDTIPMTGFVNRGIFQYDKDYYVSEIVEKINISKKDLNENDTSIANIGIFALQRNTIKLLSNNLDEFKINNSLNPRIEFYLTEELSNLIKLNKIKMKLYKSSDQWLGLTNPEDEEIIKQKLKNIS